MVTMIKESTQLTLKEIDTIQIEQITVDIIPTITELLTNHHTYILTEIRIQIKLSRTITISKIEGLWETGTGEVGGPQPDHSRCKVQKGSHSIK
ncbi:hypothetical protein DPMN_071507 [Dreissena polymorpha]|uniref:Uncharacterized protein n=1 Tax=Dreissena polymorpha TaxID=45954 RepID=A0A9D3Z4S8_DREPO|nr:hypothetical protein DPMN_071507 [Dreissena polymorpha]